LGLETPLENDDGHLATEDGEQSQVPVDASAMPGQLPGM
jgi:hypothetical protein